jgi:hypothetical protein
MERKGEVGKVLVLLVVAGLLFFTLTTVVTSEEGFFKSLRSLLTGKATSGNFNLNISVGNTAPNITYVSTIAAQDITENGQTRVTFYFTANDTDGYGNLDTASGKANFTFTNATGLIYTGTNNSCTSLGSIDAKTLNFTCTISLWYFNAPGVWNVTAYVQDTSGSQGQNSTSSFTLQTTPAFVIQPSSFTFGSLNPGSTNTTSNNDPLTLNNTGNAVFGKNGAYNLSVNATNLVGETNGAYALYGGNFTVGTYGADSTVNCGNATWSSYMTTQRFTNMTQTNVTLPYGNLSVNDGRYQMNFFVCLTQAGSDITSQAYSTNGPNSNGPWQVKAFAS